MNIMSHISNSCVTWLIHMHNLWQDPSICTWHDSFIGVTWLIHMCVSVQQVRFDLSMCAWAWLIHICDMTHSYMWHDSFIYVTWLIHICDQTPVNVRFSPSGAIWLIYMHMAGFIHMCDVTRSPMWHDSLICVTWLIHMCDMTHLHV